MSRPIRFDRIIVENQSVAAAARLIQQNARTIRTFAGAYPNHWLSFWNGLFVRRGPSLANVRAYKPPPGGPYQDYRPEDRVFVRTGPDGSQEEGEEGS